jgi:hypothetical protein
MAKVKSSGLRNYVGRLGGSVYYMLKGQNIAREKAPEVSNPRTATQMRQRMQWANLVAMYKCLQPYLGKKAFQNKLATWSDYNAFMSANLGSTPVYMTKEMVQHGDSILAPYKVSEGSLPAIGLAYDEGSIGFKSDINVSSLILGEDDSVGALSAAILDNNTTWQEGDQLGIIVMMNGRAYRPYVYAFELILDKSDTRPITDVFGIDDYPFIKSGNDLVFTYENLFNPTQGLAIAAAFIHSRTIAGKTSVSTQALVLNSAATLEYREQTTEEAFNTARESYGIPTEVWLDADYQGETAEPAELALASIAEEVTTDAAPKIELMTAGSKNKFFDPQSAGDVIGDCYITLRFNKNHGFPANPNLELLYTTGGSAPTGIATTGAPAVKANYVRLKVGYDTFKPLYGKAITFILQVDGVSYDLSLTA